MTRHSLTTALFLGLAGLSCGQTTIQYNQAGYAPHSPKVIAVAKARGDSLYVYSATGSFAGSFPLGPVQHYSASQDSFQLVDLSALNQEGTYSLMFPSSGRSFPLVVRKNPYRPLTDAAIKFFYFQRASTSLPREFAGEFLRAAGHMDTAVILHPSTGDTGRIFSPKGWYDAGDYGKYIVNSGITMYTLLILFEQNQAKFAKRDFQIPESGNSTPDLLEELRWNLDWMLTMQAKDGGIYHKLTTLRFCGSVMPAADTATRYVIGKSTAASFDFAAVMAKASLVFGPYDPTYAKRMLTAARKAYQWAIRNPLMKYDQPSDVNTGQYGDQNLEDEQYWASVEMHLATQGKEPEFLRQAHLSISRTQVPFWQSVGTLGHFTAALNPKIFGVLGNRAKDEVIALANTLQTAAQDNGYGVSLTADDHSWGSNAVIANQAIVLIHAFMLTKDSAYFKTARNNFDYILGRNPLAISYVSGFGPHSVKNPHHRPSEADGVDAPVPGMLAGGPHDGGQDENAPGMPPVAWKCPVYRVENAPARSFIDHRCSYATNEVAINWNAPLAYLSTAFE